MDPVIVVGAGPVGLTLALALARHDVPAVVLDEGSGISPEAPRSTVLRPDTAALLARLGYSRVGADSAAWTGWRTVRRRHEILRLDLRPAPPRHLAQHRLQRALLDAAAATPLVELVAGCRVEEIEQDRDGVGVRTRTEDGAPATWWHGSHLVGCDGARSTVRRLLGVRFPGRTAVDRYAVATVRTDLPFPGEARLHRDPPWRGDREVTARPLPDGIWRFDWRLPPARTGSGPVDPHATWPGVVTGDTLVARLRSTLRGWCGEVPAYDLLAAAEYTVQQRLAGRFRVGRAFLAGDAAHLLGALGMQNLDEGFRDADNLAWRLALVWHLRAGEGLLDGYEAERRAAVGARLRAVDQTLPLLRPAGRWREARRGLLSGSFRRHALLLSDGNLGTGRLGGAPAHPPGGLGRLGGGSGAALSTGLPPTTPGVLVPDIPVIAADGTQDRLRARLGRGFLIVLVAPGTGVWASEHWLGAGLMPRLTEAAAGLPLPAELLVTEEYPGAAAHAVLLVRPDGHLVGVTEGMRPDGLFALAESVRGAAPRLPAVGQDRIAAER